MSGRFAIYYAPAAGSPLWQRAAAWLGRDATGAEAVEAEIAGIPHELRREVTRSACRYGFHATLKAPMALAQGAGAAELEAAIAAFARERVPVPVGRLRLAALEGFLALVPRHQTDELAGFAQACVEAFEPFRAGLGAIERRRRLRASLTERQVDLLERFGYPYVMEQFRFHMTLTDRLAPDVARDVAAAAEDWFRPVLDDALTLDRLVLFREPEPGGPFVRVRDFPLGSAGGAP